MADFNSKYSGEQVEALLDQVASGNAGGGGDIPVISQDTYIAPFTVDDVRSLYNGDLATLSIPIALIEAVIAKKRVLIPSNCDLGDGFAELIHAEGYVSDTDAGLIAYFFVLRDLYSIYIDTTIIGDAIVINKEDIDKIDTSGGGGGITVETDPIFSKSPAASITTDKMSSWDNKVDSVSGKQLSTEDFTSALKNKLEGLSNYDDTELSEALSTLRGDFDKLVSGDTTTAIKTFNEVIAFLDGIQDTQDLSSIIASIEQQIAGKMDKVTLATVATSGSYNDLSDKPTIPSEQVNADWNATSGKAQILNKPTIPTAVTESTVSGWGFTKNMGTYSKPSAGIPKSDLASTVQTSLGKADTALQSYTEQYKGTVSTVDTSDAVDEPELPPAIENAVSANRIIACVARFDGSNWNLINDEGHTPINVIGISGTSTDEFTITFPAYSKVNSLVATPDETLAAGGIKCGASVGLDYATIRLRQDRLVRLFVTTNANGDGGTVRRQEWDTRTDVSGFTVSIKQNTSLGNYIRLDDTKGNIDGSALPTIGGAFNAFLFGTKPGYINIQLRQPDGSVSDYKNNEFQIGWPMLNVKPIFTSQEMSKGNIWIYGIMEE